MSTTKYPSLFTLVSTSVLHASIATTGIHSDAPYELASYPGSINVGAENRAWYQTYSHALDIAVFIPSVSIRSMTNDVITEDDLLGRRDLSLGGITPAPQTATCTANHLCSSIGL